MFDVQATPTTTLPVGEDGTIDEQAGTFRGVGIGDDADALHQEFGGKRWAGPNEPLMPAGKSILDPDVSPPRANIGPIDRPSKLNFYRYPGAMFALADGEIEMVVVEVVGAHTLRGVGIGDDLELAHERYPNLRCERVREEGETPGPFRACYGSIGGDRYLWFGGDPIGNITVSRGELFG